MLSWSREDGNIGLSDLWKERGIIKKDLARRTSCPSTSSTNVAKTFVKHATPAMRTRFTPSFPTALTLTMLTRCGDVSSRTTAI